jgi:hypothetical protein
LCASQTTAPVSCGKARLRRTSGIAISPRDSASLPRASCCLSCAANPHASVGIQSSSGADDHAFTMNCRATGMSPISSPGTVTRAAIPSRVPAHWSRCAISVRASRLNPFSTRSWAAEQPELPRSSQGNDLSESNETPFIFSTPVNASKKHYNQRQPRNAESSLSAISEPAGQSPQ